MPLAFVHRGAQLSRELDHWIVDPLRTDFVEDHWALPRGGTWSKAPELQSVVIFHFVDMFQIRCDDCVVEDRSLADHPFWQLQAVEDPRD